MPSHSATMQCPCFNGRCLLLNKKGGSNGFEHNILDKFERWKYEPVDRWTSQDVLLWVFNELCRLGVRNIPAVRLEYFGGIDGTTLKHLSLTDLCRLIPDFGEELYHQLQCRLFHDTRMWTDLTSLSPVSPVHHHLERLRTSHHLRDYNSESCFKDTNISSWTPNDTLEWLVRQLLLLGVRDPAAVQLEHFDNTSGRELMRLSVDQFQQRIPTHGDKLYHQLQIRIQADSSTSQPESAVQPDLTEQSNKLVKRSQENEKNFETTGENTDIKCTEEKMKKYCSKENAKPTVNSLKKSQGKEKVGRVWEFIRDLLTDPNYRHVISWVDREAGVFRFENSALAAKLWGDRKGNTHMNFKKFSRAIRYNYKMGYLLGVEKNRLIYKFGSKSHGWKLDKT